MTFFLKDVQGDIPANSTRQVTSTSGFGGLVAASTASAIENDANFKAGRTRALVRKDLVQRGVEAAGGQEVWEALQEAGKAPDVPWDRLSEDRRQRLQYPPETMQILSDMQSADPERFADFDFSDEGIEAATNERLQKEYEAAKAAVEMMPSGRGAAEFLGGMVGPTLDVKNVPFMLFGGGGGGFMRIMGRNAAINMAAEGAFLPSQFAMADRLEIPDPSIPGQLATAAAAGAVFGAGEEAIRRGLGYMRTRNAVREGMSGFEAAQWDARIAMAEEALEDGGADAMQQAARAGFPNQPSTMPPLITRVETTTGTQGVQAANAPEPAITFGDPEEAPAPATAPPSEAAPAQTAQDARSEAVDGLRSAAEEQRAEAADDPLTEQTDFQKPDPDKPKIVDTRGGGQRFHGSKNRIDQLDEFSYSDANIYGQGFYTSDAVAIADGYAKGTGPIYEAREVQPVTAFDLEQPIPDFMRAHLADLGSGETDEILEIGFLDESGSVIEQTVREGFDTIRREADYSRLAIQEAFDRISYVLEQNGFDAIDHIGGANTGKAPHKVRIYFKPAEQLEINEVSRDAFNTPGVEPAPLPGPLSEQTDAGEQTLIPGVEAVTQRDRLQAQQDAPMRGGNAAADDGLFDTGARQQRDMFSDPGQDAQKQIMDNATADLREAIASGDARVVDDFKIDLEMPDGSTRAMSASQTLDLMDDVEEFSALLDLCGSVPQK